MMEEKTLSSSFTATTVYQNTVCPQKHIGLSSSFGSPRRGHVCWKNGFKNGLKNKDFFGSYLSPLDRIRTRRNQDGMSRSVESKHDLRSSVHSSCKTSDSVVSPLEKLKGDSLYSFCYSYTPTKGAFTHSTDHMQSLSNSWVFYNYIRGTQSEVSLPACIQNPNKAILTIDSRTTEILIANKAACLLFGFSEYKLIGKKLCDYLTFGNGPYTAKETQLESSGEIIVVSGKVMELIQSDGEKLPVSVWMKKFPSNEESRCLVVMELAERMVANFTIAEDGTILSCDKIMSTLYGYSSPEELKSLNITQLIPSIILPLNISQDNLTNNIQQQQASGRARDGIYFPLTVIFKTDHSKNENIPKDASTNIIYHGVIWVFANISGMITILPNGTIHSCNTNFSQMLFGLSQDELTGRNITTLIPSFYDDIEFLDTDSIPLPPLDDDEDEEDEIHINCTSDGRTTADSLTMESRPINPIGKQVELIIENSTDAFQCLTLDSSCSVSPNQDSCSACNLTPDSSEWLHNKVHFWKEDPDVKLKYDGDFTLESHGECERNDVNDNIAGRSAHQIREVSPTAVYGEASDDTNRSQNFLRENPKHEMSRSEEFFLKREESPNISSKSEPTTKRNIGITTINSTPKENSGIYGKLPLIENNHISNESLHSIPEGNYFGIGKHRDGCDLAIMYQIRHIELDDGQVVYCLWVSRDLETGETGRIRNSLGLSGAGELAAETSTSLSGFQDKFGHSCYNDVSTVDSTCSLYLSGDYSQNYSVLQQIGKGAFGYVKMAHRNKDKLLVITKFIQKAKVYPECWAYNSTLDKEVPLEISLLTTLNHPNIVQVIDVYENEDYFQMVMEKHGSGMDLFEFVDRCPNLDESLASYIFRQVVSALVYLHDLNILHRDIKDENIILDQYFHIKLIDFGSATFMRQGYYFSTFCGTMEYCSPEVLQGNKYAGPELEMWSLGVTLYTLIFGENPFFDVDETIAAVLKNPFQVSQELTSLIMGLLNPDINQRYTLSTVTNHNWTNLPVDPHNYKFEEVVTCSPDEINPSKYYSDNPIASKTE